MPARRLWLATSLALALGCTDSSADGGGNDGNDGNAPVDCPDVVPAHDDPCDEINATCTYMDCADVGVSTATCRTDGRWDLATAPCGDVYCEAQTCAPGFICVVSIAGFPQGECVENTCGEGPIGCECPGCPDGAKGCTQSGLRIECNTCQAETCA